MYDLQIEFPAPPIARRLTFELDERTSADGEVLREPGPPSWTRSSPSLADAPSVEAVAVCFLNSYVNAGNERLVAEHLRRSSACRCASRPRCRRRSASTRG